MKLSKLVILGLCNIGAVVLAAPGQADQYPSRPITLVAPYGPGGASDLHARVVAGTATTYLKQSVLAHTLSSAQREMATHQRRPGGRLALGEDINHANFV